MFKIFLPCQLFLLIFLILNNSHALEPAINPPPVLPVHSDPPLLEEPKLSFPKLPPLPPATPPLSSSRLHPLDTITPDEVHRTGILVRQTALKNYPNGRFIISEILLKDPPKADYIKYFLTDTTPPPGELCRRSLSILLNLVNLKVYEVVIDMDNNIIESWVEMPENLHLQPMMAWDEEQVLIPDIALKDEGIQERFRALGVKNFSTEVGTDPWFYVYNAENPAYVNKRISQVFFYTKNFPNDNYYAHPVNFIAIIDIQQEKVVEIQDLPVYPGTNPNYAPTPLSPRQEYQYDPINLPWNSWRPRVKPMHVWQPEGVNFKVTGSEVEWQGFKLRVSFSAREGLILNTVSFTHKGVYNPLFYKLSLSELNLIYSDPRNPLRRDIPFDVGHYGLGIRANELTSPEDCRGYTHFFDGVGNFHTGYPKVKKNAVCIYEDDGGVLWRKSVLATGRTMTVRANRLAIMSIVTSGNYDYMFTWFFHQDASIKMEAKLNGIVNPKVIVGVPKDNPWELRHGTVMAPMLNGIYHQHIFTFRMDADIGGVKNSVHTVEVHEDYAPVGSAEDSYGNGFTTLTTLLPTVASARTNTEAKKGRTWLITAPNESLNPQSNTKRGFKLHPENMMSTMLKEGSPLFPLCAFSEYDFWATRFNDDQIYAGGFYVNQSGLPEWTKNDADGSLVEEDVVIWHSFRATHIPRVEDFPVMPVETFGFWLRPYNYFTENPSIDISPIVTVAKP